jgi:phosphatidylserine decarboxylase
LTKYGWPQWLTISLVLAIPFGLGINFLGNSQLWWILIATSVVFWLVLVSFFRNPYRRIPSNLPDGMMLSPADGVVSAVEFVDSHETIEGPGVVIRIFLSVLNVHINRAPCECLLIQSIYRKGKFLDARTEESAKVNESNTLFFVYKGEQIGLRQVSGKVARHIVCPIHKGDKLMQGEQFGMIKFGSTTELILPRPNDVSIHVKKGQSIRGGLTRLATLPPRS